MHQWPVALLIASQEFKFDDLESFPERGGCECVFELF